MCFGRSKESKKRVEQVVDLLKKAADNGGAPAVPVNMSAEMIKSQANALKEIAGALDEVAKGIEVQQIDINKIKKAGEVDKKLQEGVEKEFMESVKDFFNGVLKWLVS